MECYLPGDEKHSDSATPGERNRFYMRGPHHYEIQHTQRAFSATGSPQQVLALRDAKL